MGAAKRLITHLRDELEAPDELSRAGSTYDRLFSVFALRKIETKTEYNHALTIAERIGGHLVEVGRSEDTETRKQLSRYLGTLAILIEEYESHAFPSVGKGARGGDVLAYLMKEHGLRQADLKTELGGQSVVSEVLAGKRELNLKQVQALAKRFGVRPTVFFQS